MPLRVKAFLSGHEMAQFMDKQGLTPHAINGPILNSSGQLLVIYEDDSDDQIGVDDQVILSGQPGSAGVSYGTGSGTLEVSSKRTTVAAESFGAVSGTSQSDTLANTYVTPGSVVIRNTGSTAPSVVDDGLGALRFQGTTQRIGKVNYATGAFEFEYRPNQLPSGDLEADYAYSDQPETSVVPSLCKLTGITVEAAADRDIEIYSESGTTVLVWEGTVIMNANGVGYLSLDGAIFKFMDTTAANTGKLWAVVSGAVTHLWVHWERID